MNRQHGKTTRCSVRCNPVTQVSLLMQNINEVSSHLSFKLTLHTMVICAAGVGLRPRALLWRFWLICSPINNRLCQSPKPVLTQPGWQRQVLHVILLLQPHVALFMTARKCLLSLILYPVINRIACLCIISTDFSTPLFPLCWHLAKEWVNKVPGVAVRNPPAGSPINDALGGGNPCKPKQHSAAV